MTASDPHAQKAINIGPEARMMLDRLVTGEPIDEIALVWHRDFVALSLAFVRQRLTQALHDAGMPLCPKELAHYLASHEPGDVPLTRMYEFTCPGGDNDHICPSLREADNDAGPNEGKSSARH